MATVYSLVCFGGLLGKTVTFTDAGDVVNLTNHGLRQGVTGIVFTTTGSLPTGVETETTYYTRDGADANKFTIYPTKADALAGTNQVTFTGTGSLTCTVWSAYMLGLTTAQLARYGSSGSERIYNGMVAFNTARTSAASLYDDEVCEFGEPFDDIYDSAVFQLTVQAGTTTLTSKVNGVYSDGFHSGRITDGYAWTFRRSNSTGMSVVILGAVLDGIRLKNDSLAGSTMISLDRPAAEIKNCIVHRVGAVGGYGIAIGGAASEVHHNIVVGFGDNIFFGNSLLAQGSRVYNNLATKGTRGFYSNSTPTSNIVFVNNISIGNTTNWPTNYVPSMVLASNNAGLSTDSPWGSDDIVITTDDFVDFANNDFRVASETSALADSGAIVPSGVPVDILGNVVPNYEESTYPDNYWDIGPFEYDHGDGDAPETLTISNLATGTRVIATRTDTGTSLGTATESAGVATISIGYSGTLNVEARNASGTPAYKPWTTQISFPSTKNVIALQEVD